MNKKAVIVLRRSTGNQDVSLEAQESDCRAACLSNGYEVKSVYSDTASGAAPLEKRPGLMAAIADLRKGDVLVARSASRISRDITTHLAIEDEVLRRKKCEIFFVDGGLSDDDPQRVLMRTIKAAFAQYELALASFRTKSAMSKLRQDGRYLGAPDKARYGFRVAENGKDLVVNEDEMKWVRRIWDLHLAGVNGLNTKRILDAEGAVTRRGKLHHFTSIYRIIRMIKECPQIYGFTLPEEKSAA